MENTLSKIVVCFYRFDPFLDFFSFLVPIFETFYKFGTNKDKKCQKMGQKLYQICISFAEGLVNYTKFAKDFKNKNQKCQKIEKRSNMYKHTNHMDQKCN